MLNKIIMDEKLHHAHVATSSLFYVLGQRVKALHVEDMDVVVEPGIGWIELNEFLKPYGLFFPLDPG